MRRSLPTNGHCGNVTVPVQMQSGAVRVTILHMDTGPRRALPIGVGQFRGYRSAFLETNIEIVAISPPFASNAMVVAPTSGIATTQSIPDAFTLMALWKSLRSAPNTSARECTMRQVAMSRSFHAMGVVVA